MFTHDKTIVTERDISDTLSSSTAYLSNIDYSNGQLCVYSPEEKL